MSIFDNNVVIKFISSVLHSFINLLLDIDRYMVKREIVAYATGHDLSRRGQLLGGRSP